ncbi:MAG: Holliday junction resolvase RuvX [Halioglobus sp.]|nr:Holliday junction resolvase RuvX [Halioglobus sp.]
MPPRYLMAFDFGLRQIGIATGNATLKTSQALAVISARDGVPDWRAVQALLQEWQPDLLLVGDPINMDGSAGELALRARKFAQRLHGRFGLPVEMVDERLSSFDAKQLQREAGHRGDYKRNPIDAHAAELILGTWLNEH